MEQRFALLYPCGQGLRSRDLFAMNSLRVLIVDDEPVIRQGMRDLLAEFVEVEIAGECETGGQAIEAIRSQRPDVVLLDVQMPDCSGLDVVRQIGPERMPLVIFVTAYDEYALAAFELNAIDYLLKPFHEDRLRKSIERARRTAADQNQAALTRRLEALLTTAERGRPSRIAIRQGNGYQFVPVESIDWIESANNYVELHCGNQTHILGETLSAIETKLPADFVRVHRCRIVNVSRITAVHNGFAGTYELQLRGGIRLATGRQFRSAVQGLFER